MELAYGLFRSQLKKLENKHETTVAMLFAHLKGLIRAGIDEQKLKMKDEAMKNTDPKAIHYRFPGARQLETTFRVVAESCVASLASQKKGDFVPFFHALEKEFGVNARH